MHHPLRMMLTLVLLLCQAAASVAMAGATISPDTIREADMQQAYLHVEAPGWYRVKASSASGVMLYLLDRQFGTIAWSGETGKRDGSILRYLEAGQYLVRSYGRSLRGETTSPTVSLKVESLGDNISSGSLPALHEGQSFSTSLAPDGLARYSITVESPGWLYLEVAGRCLESAGLWYGDEFLMAHSFSESRQLEPVSGRPLMLWQMSYAVEPGQYILVCTGGEALTWAREADSHPLYLRRGIQRVDAIGLEDRVISPLGEDRILLPQAASLIRLEAPPSVSMDLGVSTAPAANPFVQWWQLQSASTSKDDWQARINLSFPSGPEDRVAVVRGEPGQQYRLSWTVATQNLNFHPQKTRQVSIVERGDWRDKIDLTGVLWWNDMGTARLAAKQVLDLSGQYHYDRTFNLTAQQTLYFEASNQVYLVEVEGVAAWHVVEPLLLTSARNVVTPEAQANSGKWTLESGIHQLTLTPKQPGMVRLRIRTQGGSNTTAHPPLMGGVYSIPQDTGGQSVMLRVNRSSSFDYLLCESDANDTWEHGFVTALTPGQETAFSVRPGEGAPIRFADSSGTALAFKVAGGEPTEIHRSPTGATVQLANPKPEPVVCSLLRSEPPSSVKELALETIRTATRARPLPLLEPDKPVAASFRKDQTRTWAVDLPSDGVYEFRSDGLLAMRGTLRTAGSLDLISQQSNGAGRNFRIVALLAKGRYYLNASPTGNSAGEAVLQVRKLTIREHGALRPGETAFASLGPHEALRLRLPVTQAGMHRLTCADYYGQLPLTVSGPEGYPEGYQNQTGTFNDYFKGGESSALLFPQLRETWVNISFENMEPTPPRQGHGPWPVQLGTETTHTYTQESPSDDQPDLWDFNLTAPLALGLTSDPPMRWELTSRGTGTGPLAAAGRNGKSPAKDLAGVLPPGRYRLGLRPRQRDHRMPYNFNLTASALAPGMSLQTTASQSLKLSVPVPGWYLVEFDASTGKMQVSRDGQPLANSALSHPLDSRQRWLGWLSPGENLLQLSKTSDYSLASIRFLAFPFTPQALPEGSTSLDLPTEGLSLTLPAGGPRVLLLRASGLLAVALDGGSGSQPWRWAAVSQQLALPLPEGTPSGLTLRLLPLEGRPANISLALLDAQPQPLSAAQLTAGLPPAAQPNALFPYYCYRVAEMPGPARWESALDGLASSSSGPLSLRPGLTLPGAGALLLAGPHKPGQELRWSPLSTAESTDRAVTLSVPAEQSLTLPLEAGPGVLAVVQWQEPVSFAVSIQGGSSSRTRSSDLPRDFLAGQGWFAIVHEGNQSAVLTLQRSDALSTTATARVTLLPLSGESLTEASLQGIVPLAPYETRVGAVGNKYSEGKLALSKGVFAINRTADGTTSVWGDITSGCTVPAGEGLQLALVNTRGEPGFARRHAATDTGYEPLVSTRSATPISVSKPSRLLEFGPSLGVLASPGKGAAQAGQVLQPGQWWAFGPGPGSDWRYKLLPEPPSPDLTVQAGDSTSLSPGKWLVRVEPTSPATLLRREHEGALAVQLSSGWSIRQLPAGEALVLCGSAAQLVAVEGPGSGEELTAVALTVEETLRETPLVTYLSPGEARLYRLEVEQARRVGIGLTALPEVVEATCFLADGSILASGVSQYIDLPAGEAFLLLRVPASGQPSAATVRVWGLTPGSGLPPEDELRRFFDPDQPPSPPSPIVPYEEYD